MGIQLAHAGRKASTLLPADNHAIATPDKGGWQAVAASAIAFHGYPEPRELTTLEIKMIVRDFAAAALRAVEVGFDVIEIHAAHGYLLHEFLSPLSNLRTDEYGGSFENRTRFLLETAKAVRAAMPDSMPLFVRISATDWTEGGWDLEQSTQLATLLKNVGVDLIDVSSAGLSDKQEVKAEPGFQVPFATAIREATEILTSGVGLITTAEQADAVIRAGKADAVFAGRAFLRNPRWALEVAHQLNAVAKWPHQIERGKNNI
jgi:2,4-dienoyl-CoA reductase-like NADH-dependent reductase (Old Yellow Enzyme family)